MKEVSEPWLCGSLNPLVFGRKEKKARPLKWGSIDVLRPRGRASGLFSVAEALEGSVFLFHFYRTIVYRAILIELFYMETVGLTDADCKWVSFGRE